eukprot:5485585-Prymnesium_polylepis.1
MPEASAAKRVRVVGGQRAYDARVRHPGLKMSPAGARERVVRVVRPEVAPSPHIHFVAAREELVVLPIAAHSEHDRHQVPRMTPTLVAPRGHATGASSAAAELHVRLPARRALGCAGLEHTARAHPEAYVKRDKYCRHRVGPL